MKHTPEPWEYLPDQSAIVSRGITTAEAHGLDGAIDPEEDDWGRAPLQIFDLHGACWNGGPDAARIVACVNACAGMADPAEEIASLRAERDAALRQQAFVVQTVQALTAKADRLREAAGAALRGPVAAVAPPGVTCSERDALRAALAAFDGEADPDPTPDDRNGSTGL